MGRKGMKRRILTLRIKLRRDKLKVKKPKQNQQGEDLNFYLSLPLFKNSDQVRTIEREEGLKISIMVISGGSVFQKVTNKICAIVYELGLEFELQ